MSGDSKETLLREHKAARNLLARLGNAIDVVQDMPLTDTKRDLLKIMFDVRKQGQKLLDDLETDKKTYGL